MLRGIILAAGKGARLNGTAGDKPKCLLRVGETTLVERQIDTLRASGINDIAVVVGCQADSVRRVCGGGLQFVENTRFAQTNSLYSLWLARPLLLEGFVVMNCDVLLHPQLLADLVTSRHEDALLLAYSGDEPLGKEEMKVQVRRGRVLAMSKTMASEDADGENVGVVRFGADGARRLVELLDARVAAGGLRDWAPRAFDDFAKERPLHAIGTRGFPWTEIDFPEDYHRAVNEILPAIERDTARARSAHAVTVRTAVRLPPQIDAAADGRPRGGDNQTDRRDGPLDTELIALSPVAGE